MGRPSSIGVLAQLLILVGLLGSTSGCGGGGSSEPTQTAVTTLPTHAEFVSRLDALCPDHLGSHHQELTQAINANDLHKARKVVARTESEAESFYGEFESLVPPAEDRAAFARYLLLTHRYLGVNERLAAVLRSGGADREVTRLFGLLRKAAGQRTSTADSLGLSRCAS